MNRYRDFFCFVLFGCWGLFFPGGRCARPFSHILERVANLVLELRGCQRDVPIATVHRDAERLLKLVDWLLLDDSDGPRLVIAWLLLDDSDGPRLVIAAVEVNLPTRRCCPCTKKLELDGSHGQQDWANGTRETQQISNQTFFGKAYTNPQSLCISFP